jgi:hypothetical protein
VNTNTATHGIGVRHRYEQDVPFRCSANRFDCTWNDAPERVQADTEVHLVESFPPGLVFGLDLLGDYGVELLDISRKTASFPTGHTMKLASPPSSQLTEVKVLSLD